MIVDHIVSVPLQNLIQPSLRLLLLLTKLLLVLALAIQSPPFTLFIPAKCLIPETSYYFENYAGTRASSLLNVCLGKHYVSS